MIYYRYVQNGATCVQAGGVPPEGAEIISRAEYEAAKASFNRFPE